MTSARSSRTSTARTCSPCGRNGVGTSGTLLSEVINYGTITTGDGKVGASAVMTYDFGYAARVIQNDAGVITTGDDSIGARVTGN